MSGLATQVPLTGSGDNLQRLSSNPVKIFSPKIAAKIRTNSIWTKIFEIENNVFINAFTVFLNTRISCKILNGLRHLIDLPNAIHVELGIYIKNLL